MLVSDSERAGTGTYQLQLAHLPGDLVVPAGDQGGALADETDAEGAITTGDFDLWSFNADAGDHVVVQLIELTGLSYVRRRLPARTRWLLESGAPPMGHSRC